MDSEMAYRIQGLSSRTIDKQKKGRETEATGIHDDKERESG